MESASEPQSNQANYEPISFDITDRGVEKAEEFFKNLESSQPSQPSPSYTITLEFADYGEFEELDEERFADEIGHLARNLFDILCKISANSANVQTIIFLQPIDCQSDIALNVVAATLRESPDEFMQSSFLEDFKTKNIEIHLRNLQLEQINSEDEDTQELFQHVQYLEHVDLRHIAPRLKGLSLYLGDPNIIESDTQKVSTADKGVMTPPEPHQQSSTSNVETANIEIPNEDTSATENPNEQTSNAQPFTVEASNAEPSDIEISREPLHTEASNEETPNS